MPALARFMVVLRVVCLCIIALGLFGMINSLLSFNTIFGIPAFPVGVVVTWVGLRYWRKLGELDQKIKFSDI